MQTSRAAAKGTTLYSMGGILLIAIAAVAALMTKPSLESFDQHLNTELRSEVAKALQTKQQDGGVVGLVMRLGCTVDVDACVRLLRSQMQVDEKDLVVARYVRVLTRQEEKNCLGAFNTWFCTGFNDR
ncbi:hypothetical protein [Methyloligella solikamskensis]|uniref:Uncharacterized protein n=1 Tax=Methyloligella solikamskensis TaxID=1177756 RepID=A0ABW3JBK1_9HYPH